LADGVRGVGDFTLLRGGPPLAGTASKGRPDFSVRYGRAMAFSGYCGIHRSSVKVIYVWKRNSEARFCIDALGAIHFSRQLSC
jgi:hypothetical protein